jgi:ABC-type multidrug transport system permease subunit
MQPFVQALPLTQLINALRAVILEGVAITTQVWSLALLAVWAAVAFSLALRWFRWSS